MGNNALRVGLGGSVRNSNSTDHDTIVRSSEMYRVNSAIGYERYVHFGKRWNLYFGADAVYNYSYSAGRNQWTSINFREDMTVRHGIGVSPMVGVQFIISPRFSVATETSLSVMYSWDKNERNHEPGTEYDHHGKGNSLNTRFLPPTNIQVRLHF